MANQPNTTVSSSSGRNANQPDGGESMPSTAASVGAVPESSESTVTGSNVSGDSISSTALRHQIGSQISHVSDAINDNLIVVRYATISTVILLGVYGVANTPLFYRYTNVMDIPSKMFRKRKWLHGRIVGVVQNKSAGPSSIMSTKHSSRKSSDWRTPSSSNSAKQSNGLSSLISSSLQRATGADEGGSLSPGHNDTTDADIQPEQRRIVVLFRHSSPMERLLTHSAMDKVLSFTGKSPSRLLYSSANPYRYLLPIELAGVVAPPSNPSSSLLSSSLTGEPNSNQFPLLDELIEKKTEVKLQLLAQQTTRNNNMDRSKEEKTLPMDGDIQNKAICHLHYRQPKQWFTSTNASLEMVEKGKAWINSCGMVVPLPSTNDDTSRNNENKSIVIDFNPTVKQLQSDTKFLSQLEEAEYSSWQSRVGMWSSDHNRGLRAEYVEEEELLESRLSTRFRSWMKRGWEWIRR